MTSSPYQQRLEFACQIARAAGDLTLKYFRQGVSVERKSDDSPVTVADREAEQLMRGEIEKEFPSDAIVGEEFPERAGSSSYQWILDPIDGTKSFVSGVPLYGTLVGVLHDQQPVIGVIHIPALAETVYANTGGGAWYVADGQPACRARVSDCSQLAEAVFCTSEVKSFGQRNRQHVYDHLQSATRLARTWGDCYGYLLVATGRIDLMIDSEMSVWDAAALLPVLQEAGGTFTDWQGQSTVHGGEGIGTNGRLLEQVLAITRGQ